MSSTQIHGGAGHDPEGDETPIASGGQVQATALDALLDEIDTVLEKNAETFVQGFVQKGGE